MSGMMNALVWRGGPNLTLDRLPEPEPGPGQVAFDVVLAGICGSDLHPYRGHAGPRVPPLVLGHEAIGTSPGRQGRFVVFPLVGCRHCDACRRGEVNLCETRGLVGLDRPGVFAERVVVAEDALVPIPEGMDDRVSVLTEPLATPVSALRLAGAEPGNRVLVFGGGPIGVLTVYACTKAGIAVELVEPVAGRRDLATRMGASRVYESAADIPGGSFDLAVDAVGIEPTWQPAIASVRIFEPNASLSSSGSRRWYAVTAVRNSALFAFDLAATGFVCFVSTQAARVVRRLLNRDDGSEGGMPWRYPYPGPDGPPRGHGPERRPRQHRGRTARPARRTPR